MASFDPSGNKSAAELEREVEMQRGRVSDTIDQIQTKLSPGQIIDQLMGASGAQDFAQNMGRSIKDNPLPVALLGASLIWLMSGKTSAGAGKERADSYGARVSHEPYFDDRSGASHHNANGVVGDIKEALGGVGERVSDAAKGFGAKVSAVGDGLGGAATQVKDAISGVRHEVGSRAHDLRDQTSSLQHAAMNLFTDQPLIAGALAFAAGAALGAALPVTSKERELVGETAGDVVAAVKDAAEPLLEKGKSMLEDAVDEGKSVLSDAKDKLGEGYEHVKDEIASSLGGEGAPSSALPRQKSKRPPSASAL